MPYNPPIEITYEQAVECALFLEDEIVNLTSSINHLTKQKEVLQTTIQLLKSITPSKI